MENLSQEIKTSLEQIAYKHSIPFCYGCYHEAPSGRCTTCFSDDLMRLVHGVGVEYGTDWVIKHLTSENMVAVDITESFEDSIRGCYDETVEIGWIEYDVVNAIKELDPISWELAESEWIDNEVSEGNLVTLDNGGSYFWLHDLEKFIEEMLDAEQAS